MTSAPTAPPHHPLQCPSRVKRGSPAWASECPLFGVKRKSISGDWMSACSHKRKFAMPAEEAVVATPRSRWRKSLCPGTCFGKSCGGLMTCDEDPLRRRPRKSMDSVKMTGELCLGERNSAEWASHTAKSPKSGCRMSAERIPFQRWCHLGMIATNLKVFWEMSIKNSTQGGVSDESSSDP